MVGARRQSGRKLYPNRRVSRRRSEITHRHPARIETAACAVDAIEPLVQPLVQPLVEGVADAAAQFLHDTGVAQVHKLRVAIRRLRGALEAFGRLLPPRELRVVEHRLRRLQHRLGTVRDWDVFAKGALWSTPVPLMSADRVKLAVRCERQRQRAGTRAVRAVGRPRFRKTLMRIERLICAAREATAAPDQSTRLLATQLPFVQFADDILRRDWQAFEDQRALCSTGISIAYMRCASAASSCANASNCSAVAIHCLRCGGSCNRSSNCRKYWANATTPHRHNGCSIVSRKTRRSRCGLIRHLHRMCGASVRAARVRCWRCVMRHLRWGSARRPLREIVCRCDGHTHEFTRRDRTSNRDSSRAANKRLL